jgi:cysteine synthase
MREEGVTVGVAVGVTCAGGVAHAATRRSAGRKVFLIVPSY